MKRLWALITFCLVLSSARSGLALGGVQRFALVIGNNRPEAANGERLRYADDDAVATHLLLTEADVHSLLFVTLDDETRGMHPGLALAGSATWPEVERGFSTLALRMREAGAKGARTELLIFYSGHGDVEGGEGYVVLTGQRLTRSMLFSLLSRSPATYNHVVVDACKSYFLVFDRGPGGHRTPYAGNWVESVPASLGNTGFVLSTSSDRESHEWERYQGGILSHQLRSGLRGAADANADGTISYAELGAFLATANRAIPNPRFKPDFMVRAPGRDLERQILSYPLSRPVLYFAPGEWGHFYLEDARGARILDAHPAPGAALRVFAPAQRPLFVRQNDELAEYVVAGEGPVSIAELTPSRPEIAQRGALSLAFQWMFSAPFGESDVRAFRANANLARPEVQDAPARPSSARRTIAWTAGVTALAASAAGITFSALSLSNSREAQQASQREVAASNERIRTFNRAAVASYGVAVAAGLTWAWAKWWPESKVTFSAPSSATRDARFFGLGLQQAF